jgi:hypothetical protein
MLSQTTSSFGDLLLSIDTYLKANIKTLTALKEYIGYSIGIDVNVPKFPYLNVFPINETIVRYYSSGIADVARTIRFESKTFKPKQDAALNQSIGLTNNLKLLFSKKVKDAVWKFQNEDGDVIVFNSKVSEIKVEDVMSLGSGIHASSSVDITFYCQIDLSSLTVEYSTNLRSSINQKEIIRVISTLFEDSKALLPSVRQFKYGVIEPINFYPALITTSDSANVERTFAGADSYITDIKIYSVTSFLKVTDAIYDNLEIIDTARKVLFANKYVFDRCYDYSMDTIDFGINVFSEDLYFTSVLNLQVKSFDSY